jgi:hypothetical protein
MNPSLKRQLLKTFSQMLADIEDAKQIELFLSDFFDDKELEKIIKRIAAIYWIKKDRNKENIKKNLLVSDKDITYCREMLKKDGIKLAIKQIEAEEWANVWVEKIKKFRGR